jgi:hypothetical protein
VPPAGTFGARRSFERRMGTALGRQLRRLGGQGRGVPDCVGECEQVIRAGLLRRGRHGQSQDFPAPGDRQRIGVLFTKVVTMRLGVSSQGAENSRGVRIDVRQGSYRRLAAGRS